jgi:hypothetical protein
MASLQDLIKKAQQSRLGKAIGNLSSNFQQQQAQASQNRANFARPIQQAASNVSGNVRAISSPQTRQDWFRGSTSNNVSYQAVNEFTKPVQWILQGAKKAIVAPIEYAYNTVENQTDERLANTLRNQQARAMSAGNIDAARNRARLIEENQQRQAGRTTGFGQEVLQARNKAAAGVLGTGLTALGLTAGVPTLLGTAALSGVMGYGGTKLSGGTDLQAQEAFGQGIGKAPQYAGINKLTAPLVSNLLSPVAARSLSQRVFSHATVNALTNVAEDYALSKASQEDYGSGEVLSSLGTGAVLGGVSGASPEIRRFIGQFANKVGGKVGADGFIRNKSGQLYDPGTGRWVKETTSKAVEGIKTKQKQLVEYVGGNKYDPNDFTLTNRPDGTGMDLSPKAQSRLKTNPEAGFVDPTGMFQAPYGRGDITNLNKRIDDLIGYSAGEGNYKKDFAVRQSMISNYLGDPTAPPEFKKELQNAVDQVDLAQDAKLNPQVHQPTKGVEAPTKPWEKLYDRKTNDLIESYAKGEEQANKLQDIPVDFQLRPKESNRIQAEIEAVEVGKRYAVKQIAEKLGISEYEALEALSTYIDAGKRRGGRTVADFYKWLPEKLTNPVVARPVSDPLEALQTESKKYGSAEEFVKAQGEPDYHGTRAKFNKFAFAKEGQGAGGKETKLAMFFDSNKDNADLFGRKSKPPEANIYSQRIRTLADEYRKNPSAEVWNEMEKMKSKLRGVEGFGSTHYYNKPDGVDVKEVFIDKSNFKTVDYGSKPYDMDKVNKIIKDAKKNGFDGVVFKNIIDDAVSGTPSNQTAVINLSTIKTKSELIDIFNRSSGGVENIKTIGADNVGNFGVNTSVDNLKGIGGDTQGSITDLTDGVIHESIIPRADIYNQATTASSSKLQPGKIQSQGQVGLEPSPQATALKTAGSTSQPKTLRQQLKAYQDKKLGVKSTGAVKGTGSSSKVILTRDNKYAFNINKKTLRLDKEASKKMDAVVETMRPVLEKNKGKTLTKQEIVEGGRKAKVLQDVVGRDEAKAFAESLQASRNLLLSESSQVGITPKFLEQLEIVSSTAADAGRRLQSFNIGAEDITIKERVLGDVLKAGATAEEILEAGRKIDWNNAEEITAFYRKFKPATIAEKLDEFRYTNMLSSPNTHINNTFSNFIQTAVLAPVEKTIRGTLSFAESRLTGKEQEYFAGQGIDFAKGYWKSLPDAWTNLKNTISTDSTLTKPDVNLIPTSNSKFRKLYTTPLRALEASDQFFRTLVKGGEMESLKRQGITGAKAAKMAERQADYRTFRQAFDPDGKLGQNKVLQVWDKWNSAIGNLRNVPGGKYLVPFLQTPTNILKQGLEYSPLGFSTVPGASDPMGQLSKAVVGSTVFAGAYAMANSGLTTWDAPTNSTEKSEFYAAGLQPYSVKIGDKWVSYSKLGPLAYPIAMASALKWSKENNGDEGVLTTAGTAMAGTLGFFADQSYVRGIGDIIDAFRGDEYKQARGLGNIPSQMVPYRAFMGWISRLVDPVYRDTAGGSVPEQIGKSIVSQIPYASKSLPARETPFGGESQRQFPGINAVSPFSISQEKPEEKAFYDARKGMRDETKKANKIIKEIEEGSVSGEVDTSKLLGDQAIKVTKKKLEAGMEVTPQELEAVYLSKATSMPSSNRYEKSQRDSELWSKSGSIMDDENLSEAQKQTLQTKIATELGISNQDLDYYQVAKQDVAPKTLYAYDKLDQSKSFDDFMKYLVNGRKPVNGKILVSDGVIDNLVDDGVIPYALGKELKNIDLDSSGKIKSSKGKARGKASEKALTARKNALNQLGEDLKKVSIGSGKIRATSGSGGKINTKALTFSGR